MGSCEPIHEIGSKASIRPARVRRLSGLRFPPWCPCGYLPSCGKYPAGDCWGSPYPRPLLDLAPADFGSRSAGLVECGALGGPSSVPRSMRRCPCARVSVLRLGTWGSVGQRIGVGGFTLFVFGDRGFTAPWCGGGLESYYCKSSISLFMVRRACACPWCSGCRVLPCCPCGHLPGWG